MIPQTQSMSFDTKTSVTSFMDDLSVLSDYSHFELPKSCIIFCPECWEIPQLSINSTNNKIISNCIENNHHKDYNCNEFCKKCIFHSLNNISCSICQQTYSQENLLTQQDKPLTNSNSNNSLNNSTTSQGGSVQFLFCGQCKDFFLYEMPKKAFKEKKKSFSYISIKNWSILSFS